MEIRKGVYEHYKGKRYEVIGLAKPDKPKGDSYGWAGTARHTECIEKQIDVLYSLNPAGSEGEFWIPNSQVEGEMVFYRALYNDPKFGNNALWLRPIKMFLEKVVVDGKKVPRFKFVGK